MSLPEIVRPLFAKATIPLTLADARADDFPLIDVNDAFLKLCGYRAEDVVGRNCRFMQTPDGNDAARAEIREALADGRDAVVRLVNRRRSGERFHLLLFLHVIRGGDGAPRYVLGSQYEVRASTGNRPEPHVAELGDIIQQASRAIQDSSRLVMSTMSVMADINANLIRRALAKLEV